MHNSVSTGFIFKETPELKLSNEDVCPFSHNFMHHLKKKYIHPWVTLRYYWKVNLNCIKGDVNFRLTRFFTKGHRFK